MKKILIIIGAILLLVVVGLIIQKETKPAGDTRVILEHTYSTYVAPPCFNDAELTNFLEDSTLENALTLEFEPHDQCTEDALASEKESLIMSVLKDIGIIQKKWDNW